MTGDEAVLLEPSNGSNYQACTALTVVPDPVVAYIHFAVNAVPDTGSLTDIADGYAHTATASIGDTVEYQVISNLPTITSQATSLSAYTFVDTLSKGIQYSKNDVVIEFFKDAACTDKITTWDKDSGKFAATYDDTANTMTISMTDTGLAALILLLYPLVSELVNRKYHSDIETAYTAAIEGADTAELEQQWEAARQYNALLSGSILTGEAFAPPLAYENLLTTGGEKMRNPASSRQY